MDAALRADLRRLGGPGLAAERLVRLCRADAVKVRDLRVLQILGFPSGEPEPDWVRAIIGSAFRSDAAVGGVRETSFKPVVLRATTRSVRRALRSWRREPETLALLEGHLQEFEALIALPLLPSRQARASEVAELLHGFRYERNPEGRQLAGVEALRTLFDAVWRSGRRSLTLALDQIEPFVSRRRILGIFREEFVGDVLSRTSL